MVVGDCKFSNLARMHEMCFKLTIFPVFHNYENQGSHGSIRLNYGSGSEGIFTITPSYMIPIGMKI